MAWQVMQLIVMKTTNCNKLIKQRKPQTRKIEAASTMYTEQAKHSDEVEAPLEQRKAITQIDTTIHKTPSYKKIYIQYKEYREI